MPLTVMPIYGTRPEAIKMAPIVKALQEKKIPVTYVLFPDEGHGFTKRKNEVEAYSRMLGFLDKHLKAAGPAPVN